MELVPAGPSNPRLCSECKDATLPLHRAASHGHLGCLAAALGKTPSPSTALDQYGNNALHAAALFGQTPALRYLLESGWMNVEGRNKFGETVVHLAAQRGRLPLLKYLLGGPLKQAEHLAVQRDEAGCTGLHAAVLVGEEETGRWLLQRFGSALAILPNRDHLTPLHIAAAQGALEFIRIATKYDAQLVNMRDKNGAPASFYAVQGGHLECLRYLVEKARSDPRASTERGQTLVHAACLRGDSRILDYLHGRLDNNAALQETRDRATPAHCAAFGGHVGALEALERWTGRSGLGKLIKAKDGRGNTPLHLATLNAHPAAIAFLLARGASPALKNKGGHTPVDVAEANNRPDLKAMLKSQTKGKGKDKGWRRRSVSTSGQSSPLSFPIYGSGEIGSPVSSGPRSSGYGSAENLRPPLSPPKERSGLFGRRTKKGPPELPPGNWILRQPLALPPPPPQPFYVYSRPDKARGVEREVQTEPDPLRDNVILVAEDTPVQRTRKYPVDAGYGYVSAMVGGVGEEESVYSEIGGTKAQSRPRPYQDAMADDPFSTIALTDRVSAP